MRTDPVAAPSARVPARVAEKNSCGGRCGRVSWRSPGVAAMAATAPPPRSCAVAQANADIQEFCAVSSTKGATSTTWRTSRCSTRWTRWPGDKDNPDMKVKLVPDRDEVPVRRSSTDASRDLRQLRPGRPSAGRPPAAGDQQPVRRRAARAGAWLLSSRPATGPGLLGLASSPPRGSSPAARRPALVRADLLAPSARPRALLGEAGPGLTAPRPTASAARRRAAGSGGAAWPFVSRASRMTW